MSPNGAIDLLSSERGVFSIALLLIVTLLLVFRFVTPDQWLTYTKWICVTLVASKTVTGALETLKKSPSSPSS